MKHAEVTTSRVTALRVRRRVVSGRRTRALLALVLLVIGWSGGGLGCAQDRAAKERAQLAKALKGKPCAEVAQREKLRCVRVMSVEGLKPEMLPGKQPVKLSRVFGTGKDAPLRVGGPLGEESLKAAAATLQRHLKETLKVRNLVDVTVRPHTSSADPARPYMMDVTFRVTIKTAQRIEEFSIKGVDAVNERELRRGLATQEDPGWRTKVLWLPLIGKEPSYYDDINWEQDRLRIQTFYRERGYYHAQITSSSNRTNRKTGKRKLSVTITENKPTRIGTIRIDGLGPGDPKLRGKKLEEVLGLKRGAIFQAAEYRAAKLKLKRYFQERSYAYADVQGRVLVVRAERTAEIVFHVSPGPRARVGQVKVCMVDRKENEKPLTDDERKLLNYVKEASKLHLRPGMAYDASALQSAQEEIYDLGIFSLATVQPSFLARAESCSELQPGARRDQRARPADRKKVAPLGQGALGVSDLLYQAQLHAEKQTDLRDEVTVIIQIKEAKPWSARIGAGFTIETVRQDMHVLARLNGRNTGGWLGKLEFHTSLGYAWLGGLAALSDLNVLDETSREDFLEEGNSGLFFVSELRYQQPRILGTRNNLFSVVRVARDVQQGYTEWSPTVSLGLSRRLLGRKLTIDGSFNVSASRYTFYSDTQRSLFTTQLGLDPNLENPSQLIEYFEERATLDYRDSPINPSRGWSATLSFQQAFDYLPGLSSDAFFLKPQLDVETYLPFELGTRWVTALRANVGTIYNLQPASGQDARPIPFKSRLFAGGKGSMRSFGVRQIGSFVSAQPGQESFDPIPIGGITRMEWSVEQRARLIESFLGFGDVWMAVFLDSATVVNDQLFFDTRANEGETVQPAALAKTSLYGLGTGIWWVTPAGPVRIDLAWTLSDISQDERFANADVRDQVLDYNFFLGIGHSF